MEFGFVKEKLDLNDKLLDFIQQLLTSDEENKFLGMKLKEKLAKLNVEDPGTASDKSIPRTIRKTFTMRTSSRISIKTVDPMEWGKHLTARDWKIFSKVNTSELLNWNGNDKEKNSPNLLQLVNSFNKISLWVASEILMTENAKDRVQVVERFIKIAEALRDLQNYHGMTEVHGALKMVCIQRLKSIWHEVSRSKLSLFKEIEKIAESVNNWKNYREIVNKVEPPFIPFEGVIFGDFAGIQENEDKVAGLVNVEKLALFSKGLKLLTKAKSQSYSFQENHILDKYMFHAVILNEEELFQLSYKVQPPMSKHLTAFGTSNSISERSFSDLDFSKSEITDEEPEK